MRRFRASLALWVLAAAGLLAAGALADSDDDHERARRAFEAGEIVSLSQILDRVERDFDGELLEVELEDEDHGFIYEVKLLAPHGEIVELLFDARSGQLLHVEGGDKDERRRDEHEFEVDD